MIVIKKLKKPGCCIDCFCESESNCSVLWALGAEDYSITKYRERRKDCPLIEIKPVNGLLKKIMGSII